jgi:hypothetical protein
MSLPGSPAIDRVKSEWHKSSTCKRPEPRRGIISKLGDFIGIAAEKANVLQSQTSR